MKKSLLFTILILIPFALNAQSSDKSIIENLLGANWQGKGQLLRSEAKYSMNWEKTLSNKFVELKFESRRKSAKNQDIIFQSRAFYKIVNDTLISGTWFDNRGITFPLKGKVKKNEMTIFWGSDTTERGKTVYRYLYSKKEVHVEDFALNKTQFFKFANAIYHKTN